jgi:hypothetical protein
MSTLLCRSDLARFAMPGAANRIGIWSRHADVNRGPWRFTKRRVLLYRQRLRRNRRPASVRGRGPAPGRSFGRAQPLCSEGSRHANVRGSTSDDGPRRATFDMSTTRSRRRPEVLADPPRVSALDVGRESHALDPPPGRGLRLGIGDGGELHVASGLVDEPVLEVREDALALRRELRGRCAACKEHATPTSGGLM